MLKHSTKSLKVGLSKMKNAPSSQLRDRKAESRQPIIYSNRLTDKIVSTKRFQILLSPKTHRERRGGSLLFSKDLFRSAKRVDSNNKQSYMPTCKQNSSSNHAKPQIIFSAYSHMKNRQQSTKNIKQLQRKQSRAKSPINKKQQFISPPLSSLTKLILGQCDLINIRSNLQTDSSLHEALQSDQYSQWINLLCESNISPSKKVKKEETRENPYQLPQPKTSSKRNTKIREIFQLVQHA